MCGIGYIISQAIREKTFTVARHTKYNIAVQQLLLLTNVNTTKSLCYECVNNHSNTMLRRYFAGCVKDPFSQTQSHYNYYYTYICG